MFDLVLIRAGESEYDGQGRIQGALDVPLSAAGSRQATEASVQLKAAPLKIAAVYAGPSSSVTETAAIIGKALDLKPRTLDLLANIDHGLWQGMLLDDVKAKQPKVFKKWRESPDAVCPPEGESLAVVRQRLQKALAKLRKKHKSSMVALVLPGPLTRVMQSVLWEKPAGDLWESPPPSDNLWELIEAGPLTKP
ncbi:histidine phosphatase family protein [Pirellulales bacterium]|nr:histidine phosphatase family protein [Pirellulales bacterium]